MTVQDIIESLRSEVTADGDILLDKLAVELKLYFWPPQVFEVAVEIFGPALNNPKSRHRTSLDRRIRHALTVWHSKYGDFTDQQAEYASSVICAALRGGHARWVEIGKPQVPPLIACVLTRLTDVVNHERVHEGFKTRDGRTKRDLSFLRTGTEGA